ncbi:MAG: membrane integrity-associated transporter subunit PqiC [Proteobacteria bacterium]|nr:membrane integrity-associated transporter subunit PqiC [Pseudomonadota bacterium]
MMRPRLYAILLAAGALAGCGDLTGRQTAPDLYMLTPAAADADGGAAVSWQLAIDEPLAANGLDSTRVVAMPAPRELKYVANMRWIDPAPKMIQTLLLQSFEKSSRIRSVDRQAVGVHADYLLRSELRDFQAEYFGGARVPTVHVRLLAKLVRLPRETMVEAREFEASVKAQSGKPADLVSAFDEALGRAMADIVAWTLALPPG